MTRFERLPLQNITSYLKMRMTGTTPEVCKCTNDVRLPSKSTNWQKGNDDIKAKVSFTCAPSGWFSIIELKTTK